MKHVSNNEVDFHEQYNSLWPQVYKYIYYKVQNAHETEELTQEVFQKVYKQLQKNNIDNKKIRAYTFMTARNIVYDLWRKRGRRPKVVHLSSLSEKGIELEYDNQIIESNLIVEEALNNLSSEDKEIITLRILQGYSIREVSEKLGMPEGTVKSRQYRALQGLREKLLKGGYFNE